MSVGATTTSENIGIEDAEVLMVDVVLCNNSAGVYVHTALEASIEQGLPPSLLSTHTIPSSRHDVRKSFSFAPFLAQGSCICALRQVLRAGEEGLCACCRHAHRATPRGT